VAKCTGAHTLKIKNAGEVGFINSFKYIAEYDYAEDPLEKIYSYQFNLYDNNYNLVLTSGELIHNSIEDDEPNQSVNTFVINKDLARD
jgi:hypothetical protein